jgi:hypothetical protein
VRPSAATRSTFDMPVSRSGTSPRRISTAGRPATADVRSPSNPTHPWPVFRPGRQVRRPAPPSDASRRSSPPPPLSLRRSFSPPGTSTITTGRHVSGRDGPCRSGTWDLTWRDPAARRDTSRGAGSAADGRPARRRRMEAGSWTNRIECDPEGPVGHHSRVHVADSAHRFVGDIVVVAGSSGAEDPDAEGVGGSVSMVSNLCTSVGSPPRGHVRRRTRIVFIG